MNGPFRSAIKFRQRSKRFAEVQHPIMQSWKLEIRADYVAIDQYRQDAFYNFLDEEIFAEENRLERFIYSMEGDGNCRFRNFYETDGDNEQGIVYQNVDYVQLAVSDFLFLASKDNVGHVFIECPGKERGLEDQEAIEGGRRNRRRVFDEWRREIERTGFKMMAMSTILQVTSADEVKMILQTIDVKPWNVRLLGIHSEDEEAYDVIDLDVLANEECWERVSSFKTEHLVCTGRADVFKKMDNVNVEVRSLTKEDVVMLSDEYPRNEIWQRIRIKTREPMNLDEYDGDVLDLDQEYQWEFDLGARFKQFSLPSRYLSRVYDHGFAVFK